MSSDGRLVSSGSQGGNVNLWNVTTGQKAAALPTGGKFVMNTAISPDGKLIACGANGGAVTVFDAESSKVVTSPHAARAAPPVAPRARTLPPHRAPSRPIAPPRAPSRPLAPLPAPSPPQVVHKFDNHAMTVRNVRFTHDSSTLVAGSDDGHISVYDLASSSLAASIEAHASWVLGIALSPDDSMLASACADHSVKLFDFASRQCLTAWNDSHTDKVRGCASSLAAAAAPIPAPCARPPAPRPSPTPRQAWGVAFDPTGKRLASVGDDKTIVLYEAKTDPAAE